MRAAGRMQDHAPSWLLTQLYELTLIPTLTLVPCANDICAEYLLSVVFGCIVLGREAFRQAETYPRGKARAVLVDAMLY
jgi:hypothetical protein